jgi:hypothetical protein
MILQRSHCTRTVNAVLDRWSPFDICCIQMACGSFLAEYGINPISNRIHPRKKMERKKMREKDRSPIIAASEIGAFVYCAKAWHLRRCGDEAQSECLEEGVIFHQKHGAGISLAERLDRIGKSLALTALILLLVLIIFSSLFGRAE